MTKPMMDLKELVEKSADADLLRDMIGFAAESDILMEQTEECTVQRARYMTLPSWGFSGQAGIGAKIPLRFTSVAAAYETRGRGDRESRSSARVARPVRLSILLCTPSAATKLAISALTPVSCFRPWLARRATYMMSVRSVPGCLEICAKVGDA